MSSELDIKFPEIFYDGAKKEMYVYLSTALESPFNGLSYAQIFIFAMALAKRDGLLPEDLKKPTKLPASAFNTTMRTLMRSIMIDERHNVYSIKDKTALRTMSQKYANAGITKLYQSIKTSQTWKESVSVLMDIINSQR